MSVIFGPQEERSKGTLLMANEGDRGENEHIAGIVYPIKIFLGTKVQVLHQNEQKVNGYSRNKAREGINIQKQ